MASSACDSVSKPTLLLTIDPSSPLPDLLPALLQRFTVLRLDLAPDPSSFLALHSPSILALVTFSAPSHLINSLPNLRVIVCPAAGYDKIDLRCCRQRGIDVANLHGVSSSDVADLAILFMLTASRRLPANNNHHVHQSPEPREREKVSGKRVGIVGLGQIGLAIAKRAEAFGCSISYQGRSLKPDVPYGHYSNVLDLAHKSDIIFVSCAYTNETRHLIDRKVLNALGPRGTLINIARGPIVDEVELVAALQENSLGAAGLDVFENEPDVPMELFHMENVVLTPHIGNATVESRRAMADLVVSNLEAYFSGKPLLTPVTLG